MSWGLAVPPDFEVFNGVVFCSLDSVLVCM